MLTLFHFRSFTFFFTLTTRCASSRGHTCSHSCFSSCAHVCDHTRHHELLGVIGRSSLCCVYVFACVCCCGSFFMLTHSLINSNRMVSCFALIHSFSLTHARTLLVSPRITSAARSSHTPVLPCYVLPCMTLHGLAHLTLLDRLERNIHALSLCDCHHDIFPLLHSSRTVHVETEQSKACHSDIFTIRAPCQSLHVSQSRSIPLRQSALQLTTTHHVNLGLPTQRHTRAERRARRCLLYRRATNKML